MRLTFLRWVGCAALAALSLGTPAVAAPTEVTAAILVTDKAAKTFTGDVAVARYVENKIDNLNVYLQLLNVKVRPTAYQRVKSPPAGLTSLRALGNYVLKGRGPYTAVPALRDKVKADIVIMFAAPSDTSTAECDGAYAPAEYAYYVEGKSTLNAINQIPRPDVAAMVVSVGASCKFNERPLRRGFGKIVGLLHERDWYTSLFVNIQFDKSIFAWTLSGKKPAPGSIENCADVMADMLYNGAGGITRSKSSTYSGRGAFTDCGKPGVKVEMFKDGLGFTHDGNAWMKNRVGYVARFR